jgi:hypothetical protein
MPCKHCGSPRTSRRAKSKYCWKCYAHLYADEARLGRLPAYHPFVGERRARVQRMSARAEKRLPLFEKSSGRACPE